MGGLRSGMGYCGAKDLNIWKRTEDLSRFLQHLWKNLIRMIFISQKRHQTTALMNKSGTGGFPEKESAFLLRRREWKQTAIIAFTLEADMWENDRSRRKMGRGGKGQLKRITVSVILTAVVLVLLFVFSFYREHRYEKMTYQKGGMDAWGAVWYRRDPVKTGSTAGLDVQLLTVNEYSRPGIATDGCVVWWFIIRLIQEVPHRIIGIILKASRTPEKIRSAAILSSDWTERSFQCIPTNGSPMHLTTATTIQCPLNVVIRMSQERSRRWRISLLWSWFAFLCGKFNLTMDNVDPPLWCYRKRLSKVFCGAWRCMECI